MFKYVAYLRKELFFLFHSVFRGLIFQKSSSNRREIDLCRSVINIVRDIVCRVCGILTLIVVSVGKIAEEDEEMFALEDAEIAV